MKKLKLFLSITALLFIGNSYSQTCNSELFEYNGQKNTQQLTKILLLSKNPVLKNLDDSTKYSLIDKMQFDNDGHPKGFIETDAQIEKLYKTNAKEVFSAIFKMEIIMCTFDTKPIGKDILVADFLKLYCSDPIKYQISRVASWCTNCRSRDLLTCCETGGKGCWDEFVVSDGVKYKIHF